MIPIVIDALETIPKGWEKTLKKLETREKNQDHPNLTIVKISHNTEKGPGDLLSLRLQLKSNG